MTAALNRDRLGKVLALLSSPQDGEALAAARMAVKLLSAAGMRPEDLAQPPPASGSLSEMLARLATERERASERLELERLKAEIKRLKAEPRATPNTNSLRKMEAENRRLKTRLIEAEAQLQDCLPPLDWLSIVDEHCRMGGMAEGWRDLEYRARTGQLTDRDKATLRGLAGKAAPKKTRKRTAEQEA
jgi:hypothetical protein